MAGTWENVFFSFGLLNAVTGITAIAGNSMVLRGLRRCRCLHGPTKALLACLALSDLGVGLFLQPVSALKGLQTKAKFSSSLGAFLESRLLRLPTFSLIFVSLTTLTAIAVDRYLALSLRNRYRAVVTTRRLVPLLVAFWFVGVPVEAAWIFIERGPRVILISTLTVSIVCITISSFAFIRCFLKLRRLQRQVQSQQEGGRNASRIRTLQYKRSTENMALVYAVFLMFYVPYCCTTAVAAAMEESTTRHGIRFISTTILFLNSSLNPVIYCWRMGEIRRKALRSS